MYTEKWLVETTKYFCDLGFFKDFQHLSDDEIAMEIISLKQQGCDFERIPKGELFEERGDWEILDLDTNRVITVVTESLLGEKWPEYNFYNFEQKFRELSVISRGIFVPQNIAKTEEKGITFRLYNKQYELVPNGPPYDHLILAEDINPLILPTGYQFVQLDLCPDIYLMLLSEVEKQKLIKDKGFVFCSTYWMFEDDCFRDWLVTDQGWKFNLNYWEQIETSFKSWLI